MITKEQYLELEEAQFIDINKFHQLLEEYTGIKAQKYVGFSYYDSAENYLGYYGSVNLNDLLRDSSTEVESNGG